MYTNLFSSQKIGNLEIPNRIVMTAMGNHMAEADGSVSPTDIAFYGARAKGGVGLIITECAAVDLGRGKGNLKQMSVDDDKYIPKLKELAEEIHSHGSKVVVQIYHPGRQGIAELNGGPMQAPSQVECKCVLQPVQVMTEAEIQDMVKKFAKGAKRLQEAGIDGVEVHAAHGYLINQFLSPYTNKRTDQYGGSLENRVRFLAEIMAAIRKECGAGYPIIVRLSIDEHLEYVGLPKEGIHLEDGIAIAKHLEKIGVDALDISCGIYETMNTAWEPVSFDQGWKINAVAAVKQEVAIPVIGVSVIRDPAYGESVIKEGKADFIGSARSFFADEQWAVKAREGRDNEIRKCISCLYCMETLMEADITQVNVGCAINYKAGREMKYGEALLKKDGRERKVAVIGAGPAGLEAARILAMRNFKPVVFEKSPQIGGQVYLASKPPKKEKTAWLIDYEKAQLEKLGVEIRLNSVPTLQELQELNPYAVFLAHGSKAIMPKSIPGLDGGNVVTPAEILSGNLKPQGQNICVVGSGMTGLETAELLCEAGNRVAVYEMAEAIGPGIFFQNLMDVMSRLGPGGVELYPKHKLEKIRGQKAVFEKVDTKEKLEASFDLFVISLGTTPNQELVAEIKDSFNQVVLLGDAIKSGRIESAISSACQAAFRLG